MPELRWSNLTAAEIGAFQARDAIVILPLASLREISASADISGTELRCLAAELDAYLNGVGMHFITGTRNLDPDSVEASLAQIVQGHLGVPPAVVGAVPNPAHIDGVI